MGNHISKQLGGQTPRRHHYVPEFYLKGWVNEDGRLMTIKNLNGQIIRTSTTPKHTGFEWDLYSYDEKYTAAERAEIEERFFKPLDQYGSNILTNLISNKDLNTKDKVIWSQFLMAMRVRTPFNVSRLKALAEVHWTKNFPAEDKDYARLKSASSPESFDEWAMLENPGLRESIGIKQLPRLLNSKRILNDILSMRWLTLDVQLCSKKLVTSDNPAIFTSGLQHDNCIICLPLSPDMAFFAFQPNSYAEKMISGTPPLQLVKRINESVTIQAQTRIYSRQDLTVPDNFVQRYLSQVSK